jgi:thiol-disulfide isomerase/thioredoxin
VLRRLVPALLGALLLTACTGTDAVDVDRAESPKLKVLNPGPQGVFRAEDRAPTPTIAGTTLDGEPLDVADMRGKVVVVNFWASWCAPCRAESHALNRVHERRSPQGVQFVGVNIKDDRTAAKAFERRQATDYPSLYDQAGIVLTRFARLAPQTPPTTLLIDKQGRVAGRFIGQVTDNQLDGPLQVLLKEPA